MITNVDDLLVNPSGVFTNAEQIKGVPVDNTAIGDGKVLSYDGVNSKLIYKKVEGGSGTGTWGGITGTLSAQTDLQSALNGKANTSHTHTIENVTNLQTTLDSKVDKVVGKGLSTNDYSDTDEAKLISLRNNNEVDILLGTKVDKIVGKGLSTNDLTNGLKEQYDTAVLLSHTHTNKTLLDSLVSNGDGTKYLSDDGTYKTVIGGSGIDTFVELTDVPSTYTGQENKYVRVNSTADGLEFTEGIATTRIIEASGIGLSISNGDGANGNPTVTSNATAVNTPNTIVARDSTGHFVTRLITATLKGKADTADKLKTSRNIGIMTGDVISVGSTFDGSANNTNDNIIANNVVDNDKLADMPTKTLKGNDTLITDNPKDLTVSEVQTMITDSTHRFVTDSQISQWNSSSSLVDTFVELTDTPNSYLGQENKYVRVNPTADGLEFIEGTGGGVASFTQLNDVPTSYVGQANKMVTVNDSETGLDFTDMPIIPTKTSDLTNDSNFIDDSSYIHTDNNYTTIEKTKLSTIEENANNYVLPSNVVIDENYVHTDTNYTQTEKTKLSGIMDGAEVNVQADWNTTDVNDDSFIKNKPTIVDTFLELDDTPTSYSGNADKVIAVNSTGTGLTFVDGGSGGGFTPISMYKAINTLADIGRADGQMSWFANPNVNQGGVYLTKLSPTLYDVSFYFRYNYVTTSTSLTAGQTITLTFAIDTGLGSTFSSYLQRKLPTEGKFQYQQGVCISSVPTVVGDFYIENGIININYYIKNNQTAARTLSQLGFVGPNWYSGRMILDLGTGDLTPLSL